MHHYISCFSKDDDISTEEIVKMLLINVWKIHELSIIIIFDRDSQFVVLIWKFLCQSLKIKAKLFIAFHFETNE
jgi:hypothetical protein